MASKPTSARTALSDVVPLIAEEMHRINRLMEAGDRRTAIEQFHALASVAICTQRDDLTSKGYLIRGRTIEVSVCRIPAQPRPGKPIALFLPGLLAALPLTAVRALAFIDLFDIVLCELPGHGASGETADVSFEAFAQEYAALIDNALSRTVSISVIGESLGGLVALALGRLRPGRIGNVILIDTPFHVTRPDLAEWIGTFWKSAGERPYIRRICREIMGFDPADGTVHRTTLLHDMVKDAPFTCALIAGGGSPAAGLASVLQDVDMAALQAAAPAMLMTPRVPGSGHAVLLDNPDGARAALETLVIPRRPPGETGR